MFHVLFGPFYRAKLKKILGVYPVFWTDNNFWPKMAYLPNFFFFFFFFLFSKTTNIIFMYLLAPFIFQISKKSLGWIQSYEDVPFLSQKLSICPKWEFFQKNHWSNFNVPLCFLHEAKFQKTPYSRSKVMRTCHF